jgi:glycosyltransferase involved in cell wall biosynthesis
VTPNENAPFRMTLAVVGHAAHWIGPDGKPWAYEPYVREARLWADLFESLEICSPRGEGPLRANLAPYERSNINWTPVPYTLSYGGRAATRRLQQLPGVMFAALRAIRGSGFVHLRSPGHFGLIGAVLVRLLRRPSLTKWAGENGSYPGERLPSRLERLFQGIPSDRHPVLVYGPAKRPHQISFLPALMSGAELEAARELAALRRWEPPWRILAVGRLEPVKNMHLVLEGLAEFRRRRADLPWLFTLVGDGSARQDLEARAAAAGLADRVRFTGSLPFREVQRHYAAAHVAIMPGTKEGWPKIIAEAWAHGAVPIAASAGLVPWLLREEGSGRAVPPTADGLATALEALLADPAALEAISRGLYRFAEGLSLEQFRVRLRDVLVSRCGLRAEDRPDGKATPA